MKTFAFAPILLVVTAVGCAAPHSDDVSATDAALVSTLEPGIQAAATWRRAYVGTPTYGYEPTAPFVTFEVVVEDAALRTTHPAFDGYESAFVLLPRAEGGQVRWERLPLPYRSSSDVGYYSMHRVDTHGWGPVRFSEADFTALATHGFAVGLETNVGVIWAQKPGDDFRLSSGG